jgi:Chlorite dismutase
MDNNPGNNSINEIQNRTFSFLGGEQGPWVVTDSHTLAGPILDRVNRIEVLPGIVNLPSKWTLIGMTSNDRYVTRPEKVDLVNRQEGLGRPNSSCAALIPIRKNPAWWAMTQDERRKIFEESSAHIQIGFKYLPAIARRLHHCRDLAIPQPFDFITWFEFAPSDIPAFNDLLAALRATPEWKYVDRESDLRLIKGA